ncbi:hypothetical protein ABQJ54_13070 [Rhodanobacter sp. Si-c]|uniref:RING-type E3 ubiquitin transferase n=1 Tax=Rhodanobacter lycopersici TaxID=3162487 RepID=A0ABV3QFR4_9GAMM
MGELVKVLSRVRNGEYSFEPSSQMPDALLKFQPTARALAHAMKEGYLERCEFKRESYKGTLLYSGAYVVRGLSYAGDEFLEREATIKGRISKYAPSALKWALGIVAGVVLAALVRWLIG